MAVEFRLLGTIEARVDGQPITIGYAQLQGMLAVLLAEANRTVSVDQLVDRVWGTRRLPRSPRSAVQHGVSLLRRALSAVPEVTIAWRSTGYRLAVDPRTVDLHRFRELIDQARATADDDTAAGLFEQALRLWHGEPFAGLDTLWFDAARASLTALHTAARLDLIDVQLRRGRHTALLAELADLTDRHPLDERLAGQYMLTLYRSGRQAQALEHYQRVRRRLAEQLGADPSPPLRRLHVRILNADAALAAPTACPAGQAVPRQLPAGPRQFTGRGRELARLTAALDRRSNGTVVISAIGGAGGIGKTWLALRWAHQHLDRFPDGQLHVNLHGFDPTGRPMPPATAVRGFLAALGVEPAAVPADLDAQAALYRSLVAGRRMLIVLDNARDAAQVEPLLPGSATCAVLVTSRHQLTGLVTAHGAHHLSLDVLPEPEARDLLAAHLGRDRIAAEPDAVAELVSWCAGLPLAISIVAARAGAHPDFPLSALAHELRDHTGRLDALDDGDPTTSLRAVLSWSYDALPADAARVFELLGLACGPDIALPAAVSLTALPAMHVHRVLRVLENAHLVQQHRPGRYRMHDLIRLYAAEQARHHQPTEAREAALRRLVDCYLHTAFASDRLLDPHRRPVPLGDPVAGCRPEPPQDRMAALAWFAAEHANLRAAQQTAVDHGWDTAVWQLAWAMGSFHHRQGHLHEAHAMWRAGLAAADRLADPVARIRANQRLGDLCASLGRHVEALEHLRRALDLAEQTGDVSDQALTHTIMAWIWNQHGDDPRALEHAMRGLRLIETLDKPTWQAVALNQVGWYHAQLGHYEQAHAHCEAALAMFRRHADREGEATTLDSLGYVAQHTGQHERALHYYRQALDLLGDVGDVYEEAATLERLGHTHGALGQHGEARTAWRRALTLYRTQQRTAAADRVQRQLDGTALNDQDH